METLKSAAFPVIKKHFSLLLFAGLCICLLLVRAKITQSVFYFFLIWNLFLAWLPLALSTYLSECIGIIQKKCYLFPSLFIWLLLLPNAPYIITDFIHLNHTGLVAVWFDVILLISFSLCGLLMGLKSMKDVFIIIMLRFNRTIAWIFIIASSLLSGFGIYLGRFLRYNSWDIIHRPMQLTTDICTGFTNPLAIVLTLGFGVFLLLAFGIFRNTSE